MLERVANYLKRGIFPTSRVFNSIGVWVLALMVPMIVADVFRRRLFDRPITGVYELTILGLVLVSFLTLAYCGIKGAHIEVDILTVRFPKRVRSGIAAIMYILTVAMLGVLSWQLGLQALRLQRMGQTSGVLGIPVYPFFYVATLCSILLTLVFLIRFLYTMMEFRK